MKITHHSSAAVLALDEEGVLTVAFSGPLTLAVLMGTKDDLLSRGWSIRAFLVDYRRCLLAVSREELDEVLKGECESSPSGAPAAMLVLRQDQHLFRRHCISMALRGFARRIFSEAGPARLWLQSELEYLQDHPAAAAAHRPA